MKRDTRVYLDDILESIKQIEKYTKEISKTEFFRSTQIQDAVVRRLEIIGEAIKHITKNVKEKHTEIKWRESAGMRDIMIHEYFGVKLDRVWNTVKKDLPKFKKQIENLLKESED